MTESEFRIKADHALEHLERALIPLADDHGLELDLQGGVLQVVFEDPAPAKFVVSPNGPVRQGKSGIAKPPEADSAGNRRFNRRLR